MDAKKTELQIWPNQLQKYFTLQGAATALFDKIDPKLGPKIFFLGLLVEDCQTVCLVPDDCGFSPDAFSDLKQRADDIKQAERPGERFHEFAVLHGNHAVTVQIRPLLDAVKKTLNEDTCRRECFYVADPVYIEGFMVFTVLSLDKKTVSKLYTLKKSVHNITRLQRSLTESAVMIFLKECIHALKDPSSTDDDLERRSEELLSAAGRWLCYTAREAGHNFGSTSELFDACNEIASMKYEGAVGIGTMIIAHQGHENIKLTLELKTPISLSDFRMVRKFLEVSDGQSAIICDSNLIYGLGELVGNYNADEENIFTINFTSHYKWVLLHNQFPLMQVEYRRPRLPSEKVNKDKFFIDLRRLFQGITDEQINELWVVTDEASEQKHGTMLVISDQAASETTRLGMQSTPIAPIKLSAEMIRKVTSIDGAVLLDRQANCHAIGVILDGLATEKGDPARGARYNSAIRYYMNAEKKGLIVIIISEDGMINLVPDLRPQIDHHRITDAIATFKQLLDAKELDHSQLSNSFSFFKQYNFYLTQEECDVINDTKRSIQEKFLSKSKMGIPVSDFQPHPEMDDSYYL